MTFQISNTFCLGDASWCLCVAQDTFHRLSEIVKATHYQEKSDKGILNVISYKSNTGSYSQTMKTQHTHKREVRSYSITKVHTQSSPTYDDVERYSLRCRHSEELCRSHKLRYDICSSIIFLNVVLFPTYTRSNCRIRESDLRALRTNCNPAKSVIDPKGDAAFVLKIVDDKVFHHLLIV